MDDLIRKWVWMEAMNHALGIVKNEYHRYVYPNPDSSRDVPYNEFLRNIFEYALKNWHSISYQGCCSSHNHFSIGYWQTADSKGAYGEYKNIKINISWDEVKSFIKKMLTEEPKDRQMDLLELLAEIATNEQK